MKVSLLICLCMVVFVLGVVYGLFLGKNISSGKPYDDSKLLVGNHQIVAVVEVKPDYALVVLKSDKVSRYYKINKKGVLNFGDIASATKVIKVKDKNLEYIEFK